MSKAHLKKKEFLTLWKNFPSFLPLAKTEALERGARSTLNRQQGNVAREGA